MTPLDRLRALRGQAPEWDPQRAARSVSNLLVGLGLARRQLTHLDDAEQAWWRSTEGYGEVEWRRVLDTALREAGLPPDLGRRGPSEGWDERDDAIERVVRSRTLNPYLGPGPEPARVGRLAILAAGPDAARWAPLLDAFESGLWMFWVLEEEVLLVPRPELSWSDGRLHSAEGPAVRWPWGGHWWCWNGVRVPREVVEAPDRLRAADILDEENVEVRRVMIERFGADRLLREADARLVDRDRFGSLHRIPLQDDEALLLLKVRNATPEADGSFRDYVLRVPPGSAKARDAVAWTFGLSPGDYEPLVES